MGDVSVAGSELGSQNLLADEDVRADMSDALDRIAPEDRKGNLYRHSCEGPDDMPVGLVANTLWLQRNFNVS